MLPPLGGPGQGGSTSGTVNRARLRRMSTRSREKNNPSNVEFDRQVAAVAARQEEEERMRQMYVLLGSSYLNVLAGESLQDAYHVPLSRRLVNPAPPLLIIRPCTRGPLEPNQQEQKSDSSFLEGTFLKISSDKQKSTTNQKNSKNKKKKKGKGRTKSHASEMCNKPSTCVNAASDEALAFSSSVAVGVPLLDYSSSSSSSPGTELISPVSSASSGNEKEISSSSNAFRSFCTSYDNVAGSSVNDSYTGSNACNNTRGDSSLSDTRSEWSWSATGLGFNKWGGDRNKPNDRRSFSVTISPGSSQEDSVCSDDAGPDAEFQKVISRKTAQKMKKIQRLRNPTTNPTMAASVPISGALVPRAPSEITIGHYIKDDCFSGRKPNHRKGKYQKDRSLNNVPKTGSTDEGNVPSNSRMLLTTMHPRNLESSQMEVALSSTSHHHDVALEDIEESCSSGCLPLQGELKALAPADGDAKDTDSRTSFSDDKSSSLDNHVDSSCVDREEQKKEENEQALSNESELDKIIEAVSKSYEIQVASDMYMTCGHPVANIETFLQSATPVIGQIPCTSNSCLLGQSVPNKPYRDQMSSVSLRSVWEWYEEPNSFGIEVEIKRNISFRSTGTGSGSELCVYFVPSLSAVQLFGLNNGGLLFEYFEWENPYLRPPLFTKIKQLVSGMNLSRNALFGDPKQLETVELSDLHPASWFCVAWYPIYQIPSTAGSCQSAFLTYHSLGQLAPQTCSTDIICRIVGLLSYKDEEVNWFRLGEEPWLSKPTSEGSLGMNPIGLLNERLQALRHSASAMSNAVVLKASRKGINYHPDYKFFWSRSF